MQFDGGSLVIIIVFFAAMVLYGRRQKDKTENGELVRRQLGDDTFYALAKEQRLKENKLEPKQEMKQHAGQSVRALAAYVKSFV